MAGAGRTTIVVKAHLVHPRANDPGPYLISVMGLSFLAFFAIFIQPAVGAIALAAVLAAAIWSARTRNRWAIRRVVGPVEDPRRSLLAVRHAMVGPWEVRVVPVEGGFRARARHERSSEERRCPDRPTLAEAMDDARDLIDDLEPAQT